MNPTGNSRALKRRAVHRPAVILPIGLKKGANEWG